MSKKGNMIFETGENSQITVSGQGNGRNGHHSSSALLSWYFAQPPVEALAYALTAHGYVILSTEFSRSWRGFDTNEVMM